MYPVRDFCHPRIQVAVNSLACNVVDRGNHRSKPYITRPDPKFLWTFEITSALRNKVYRQIITQEEGFSALNQIRHGRIEFIFSQNLVERAWAISEDLELPTAYDAFYLALAKEEDCEFWTADKNLVKILKRHKIRWAKWIGE